MTTRHSASSSATDARRWKRCFSTWRAGGGPIVRSRNEQQRRRCELLAQPRQRDGTALLVPAALVLAAHSRPNLLGDRADADVGLPAALRDAERRSVRARQRRVHRRGTVVGYTLPRPARLFHLLSRRDVRAQSRQPDDVAIATGRIHLRADDYEHCAPVDRHDPGDAARDPVLWLQSVVP